MKKRCTGCEKTKPIKQFHKHRSSQDGHQHRCKVCRQTYSQSEKGKKANEQYEQSENRKKNRKQYDQSEKRKQVQKRYDQSQKGRRKEKQYDQSEKGKQKDERFRKSDKGKQCTRRGNAIYRTRKTQAGGSYSPSQWHELCKFYDFRCLKCNKKLPFEKLTLDHVKPVSKGGSSDIWNTQPLCKSCNSKKKDKEIDYRKTLPDWINRDVPVWQQDELF